MLLTMLVLSVAACLFSLQLRKLQKEGEALAAGNLDAQVDTKWMYWDVKRHAENLNSIGDGMAAAIDKQLKSERLKTELITNVSHDIKTPLTSIINYVDLLQHEHTPEQEEEYLAVLKRQAFKLKKLTEDLVEASKATTGNLPVNAVQHERASIAGRGRVRRQAERGGADARERDAGQGALLQCGRRADVARDRQSALEHLQIRAEWHARLSDA